MFEINDKTAVITGAGKGIGKSMALLFARQGAHVHILDTDKEAGEAVVSEIQKADGAARFHHTNVADQRAVNKAFDQIAGGTNRLDILINNAGISHIGTLGDTSREDMERLFKVNVMGVYNCARAGVQKMEKHGGGVILNMASLAAVVGLSERFAYSMTKGAVLTMTYSIAKDYLDHHIRCNAISPARVHTPFVDGYLEQNYPDQKAEMFEKLSATQPIGRMGKPEEIAGLALYLCSEEAGFITGANYKIDGGFATLNT